MVEPAHAAHPRARERRAGGGTAAAAFACRPGKPAMTRQQRRLVFVLAGMATLGIATGLVLYNLKGSLVFFYSPTDLVTQDVPKDRRIRIGGLVATGSVKRDGNATVEFRVTDTAHSV